jgi:hypothetical protein
MRFQELMSDALHWLGIRKIHRLVSMSNMSTTPSPPPHRGRRTREHPDAYPYARVEIDAKMAAGYFTPGPVPDADELRKPKGRGLDG